MTALMISRAVFLNVMLAVFNMFIWHALIIIAVLLGGAVALLPVYARDVLNIGASGLGLLRCAPDAPEALAAVLAQLHLDGARAPTLPASSYPARKMLPMMTDPAYREMMHAKGVGDDRIFYDKFA